MSKTLSRAAMACALEVITRLKLSEEHQHCDRDECEIARDRWTHCEHGTYVGDWAGPDYMCGPCEDGTNPYDYALGVAYSEQERHVRDLRERMLKAAMAEMTSNVDMTHWLSKDETGALVSTVFEIAPPRRGR